VNNSVQAVTVSGLIWGFVPVLLVIGLLFRWTEKGWTATYSVARMLIQLLLIGYVLVFIFEADHAGIIIAVLTIMLVAASWIAIQPLQDRQPRLYLNALIAIFVGGVFTLVLVTQVVLSIEPWFLPRYMVPLAGMVFANAMNAVSLAAERFEAERMNSVSYERARSIALRACMIPVINSLFAVGLVSLPGMMTGQILSGVSPVIAARYQIVVMCMIFGASGLSAGLFLLLERRNNE
jgi:putative ABC transport system permease protein